MRRFEWMEQGYGWTKRGRGERGAPRQVHFVAGFVTFVTCECSVPALASAKVACCVCLGCLLCSSSSSSMASAEVACCVVAVAGVWRLPRLLVASAEVACRCTLR